MRLANGIVLDKEKTFGTVRFSALRHEVYEQNEDGTQGNEIKRRVYNLKCEKQKGMIQVSVPSNVPLKDYEYNVEVELINPVADTIANVTGRTVSSDWYIKCDDIVLKNKSSQSTSSTQNNVQQVNTKK
ncbi:YdcP family protein [Clostridium perfringens]